MNELLNTLWDLWCGLVTSVINPSLLQKDDPNAFPWGFALSLLTLGLISLFPMCYTIRQAAKQNARSFPYRSLLYSLICSPIAIMAVLYGTVEYDPTLADRHKAADLEYEQLQTQYQQAQNALRRKYLADKDAIEKKYNVRPN